MTNDTPAITITREETGRKGRFVARIEGIADEAEMTFTTRGPEKFSIDHTGVPESMGGKGVASALAKHAIAHARAQGQTIIPLCPYFRAYVERRKDELTDVIAQ